MVGNSRLESPQPLDIVVSELLQLNYGTSLFDSLLQVLSLVLRQTFLQSRRSTVYEILSFLQTQTASFLNGLYNLQLSSTSLLQHYVERRLLLSSGSFATCSGTSSNSNSCSGGLNSILVLQDSCQLLYFFYCEVNQLLSNSFNICHFI